MAHRKGKHIIRRMAVALASLAMIAGFVVLFIAASKDRNKAVCKAMVIHVTGNKSKIFVDTPAIENFITKDKHLNPVGKRLGDLDITLLERSVKTFPWVEEAELYVDNDDILRVNITERIPVARIFTTGGNSFYTDSRGMHLPVNGNFAVKLPVFTGFPGGKITRDTNDSLLLSQVISLSRYISGHPFWMAQVDQININSRRAFELIPTVGNAFIEFGDGNNIPEKFNKLLVFYQKGLNNIGWGYYDTLNLQYKGQVVAVRRKGRESPVVDSLLTADSYADTGNPTQITTTKLNTSQLKQ